MRNVTRLRGHTYYKDDCQILEDCVDWYSEVLLRKTESESKKGDGCQITHEALGAGVYHKYEQCAHRKPHFRILYAKISERNDAQLLDSDHACNTDDALQTKQKERHIELTSRYHKLRWCESCYMECTAITYLVHECHEDGRNAIRDN